MYIINKNYYKYFEDNYSCDNNWNQMISMGGSYLEGLEDVKKDLISINTLIEMDFDKICAKEFSQLISRFFSVSFTIKDLLNLISRVTNVYYDKIELLNTRETFETYEAYGHGKDRDYKSTKYQVNYVVTTSRNFKLDSKYNYSQEEINDMKSNKQIIILSLYPINVTNKELLYKEIPINVGVSRESTNLGYIANKFMSYNFNNPGYFDDYYSNLGMDFNYFAENDNEISKKLYREICSMIKMRFNREQVLMLCEEIISFLKFEYDELFNSIERSYLYADYDKERYLNLAKEIIEINESLVIKLKKNKTDQSFTKTKRRSYL